MAAEEVDDRAGVVAEGRRSQPVRPEQLERTARVEDDRMVQVRDRLMGRAAEAARTGLSRSDAAASPGGIRPAGARPAYSFESKVRSLRVGSGFGSTRWSVSPVIAGSVAATAAAPTT